MRRPWPRRRPHDAGRTCHVLAQNSRAIDGLSSQDGTLGDIFRETFLGFMRVHNLYHASKGRIFGLPRTNAGGSRRTPARTRDRCDHRAVDVLSAVHVRAFLLE